MRTDQQPVRIALFAPEGRMGNAIAAAIEHDSGFELDNDNGDVLVDFSAPDALQASLDRALSAGIPILIGTTGLDDLADQRIAKAAETIAVLKAPNTSLGVALLSDLVERAAKALGPEQWDIEIVEAHHKKKSDAPSGTAAATAKLIGGDPVIHSVRLPGLVAHQEVIFGAEGQLLTIRHDTTARESFADGVLLALSKLSELPAGLTVGLDALL